MGKRELLLIVGFVLIATLVYQFTAPPPAPGEQRFSVGRLLDHVRREIRGNRASAEVTRTSTHAVGAGMKELRLNLRSTEVTITGEDRPDIAAELYVLSHAYDEPEAARLARETVLILDPAGSSLAATIEFPEGGRQRARLSLKIPSRLSVRVDNSGRLTVAGVAGAEIGGARGETTIRQIAGRVTVTHNGGELTISEVGSLRLTTRGSDVRAEKITGDATFNLRAGELKLSDVAGPIEVESNSTDVSLESLGHTTGTIRVNAVNGTVTLKGLRTDARVDARNAEVDLVVDRAAPLAVYSDGEPVILTPPPGGYQLDAVATDGRITLPAGIMEVTTSAQQQRATGAVEGGGPTITVRTTRANITIRAR